MTFLVELDPRFERIFYLLQDEYDRMEPTVDFCIRMFTLREEEQAEYKQQVLSRWNVLANVFSGWTEKETLKERKSSIFSLPLRLDERILRYLFDRQSKDFYFNGTVKLYEPQRELPPMLIRAEQVKALAGILEMAEGGFVSITGAKGAGKKFLVSHYCKQQEKNLLLVDVPRLVSEVPAGAGR